MDNEKFKRILPLFGVGSALVFLLVMSASTFMISSRASRQQNVTESYAEEFMPNVTLPPGRAWQGIAITGDLEGRFTIGYRVRKDDYCDARGVKLAMGKLNGLYYVFNFSTLSDIGDNSYKGYLQLSPLDIKDDIYGGNVTLVFNDDQKSGTVDGDLTNSDRSLKTVHISGDWACP